MNIIMDCVTIHFWLISIDAMKVVVLLMIVLVKYVTNKMGNANIDVLKMITRINESKILTKYICKS